MPKLFSSKNKLSPKNKHTFPLAFHPLGVISKARSFWKMTNLFKPIVVLPSSHKHRQLGLHVFSGNVLDRKMVPDHPNHFEAAGEDITHPATVIYEVRVDSFQRTLETSSRVLCGAGVISIPLYPTWVTHVWAMLYCTREHMNRRYFAARRTSKFITIIKSHGVTGRWGRLQCAECEVYVEERDFPSPHPTDTGKSTRKSRRDLRDWWWSLKARALIWKFGFRKLAKDARLKSVVFFSQIRFNIIWCNISNLGDNHTKAFIFLPWQNLLHLLFQK